MRLIDAEKLAKNFEGRKKIWFSRDEVLDEISDAQGVDEAVEMLAICDDFGLTPEGVRFALEQYQDVVSTLTNGRFSKLTYPAGLIIDTAMDCFREDMEDE